MWLWKANFDAVLEAMCKAGIESFREVCERAPVNKNTMTKVSRSNLVKEDVLRRIAAVLNVKWGSLHSGQVYRTPGPRRSVTRRVDDISYQVIDALAAFGRLAAYRTGHDPDGIRCLAYLFDNDSSVLRWMGAYTGTRTLDDHATEISCSRKIAEGAEEEWYIVCRAFSRNEYVCDNVDWDRARSRKYPTARKIWDRLRGVAASPIRPREGNAEPIGVVCVDSAQTVAQVGWAASMSLQGTLESLAEILYVLVADTGYFKKKRRGAREKS